MLFSPIPLPLHYLDPGSGSIIIQMIIAALLGVSVIVRSQWSKIKGWFGKKNSEDNVDDTKNE